jgi:hypothetical protein
MTIRHLKLNMEGSGWQGWLALHIQGLDLDMLRLVLRSMAWHGMAKEGRCTS